MTNEEAIDELKRIRHHGTERLIKALEVAISALESQRWIPVTYVLPNNEEDVLVLFDNGVIAVGFCISYENTHRWHTSSDCGWDYASYNPTHWMPLPSTEGLNDSKL